MKSHPPTLCVIVECANKCPGKLLAKALAHEVDLPYKDAVTMCERNGIDPFQICGDSPLKHLANADDDTDALKAEMRANSIDIDSQLSIISGIILRLDAIESQLNQEIQAHSNLLNVQLSTIEELLSRVDTLELGDTKTKNAIVSLLARASQLETTASHCNP